MSVEIPSTFLDLAKRTALEVGIASQPTTVVGQTGELQKIVVWVATSWLEIQSKHLDWHFLRKSTSWVTVAGQGTYTTLQCGIAAGRFGLWDVETFRNYTTAVGTDDEIHMVKLDYDDWRDGYLFGATRSVRSRPTVFAVTPGHGIALGPVPATGYTCTADYFEAPVPLTLDVDVSIQ